MSYNSTAMVLLELEGVIIRASQIQ